MCYDYNTNEHSDETNNDKMCSSISKKSDISIYAEFLSHISQVTIFITLNTNSEGNHIAMLKSDKQRIEVSYAGQKAAITYPNGIAGTVAAHIPIQAAANLSFRLNITEKGDPRWRTELDVMDNNAWNASGIESETSVACRKCQFQIMPRHESAMLWKDLPRSGWTEMIELWHCHRPQTSRDAEYPNSDCGANATCPVTRPGTVFVDASDIILNPHDCHGVQVTSGNDDDSVVSCKSCFSSLGAFDEDMNGIRLRKWKVMIKRNPSTLWEKNEIQNVICAKLLELIESQARRKFILIPDTKNRTSQDNALILWVLIPDLKFCASYICLGYPRRAMKLLYKTLTSTSPEEIAQIGDDASIILSEDDIQHLYADLVHSTQNLPVSARELQGWNVGLLERFNEAAQI